MSAKSSFPEAVNWQEQAHQYLVQGQYDQAASLYEQAIAAEPEVQSHYWHLGLLLLLQGHELEAQTTWMLAMAESEPEQVEMGTAQLMQVLQTEAQRLEAVTDYSVAWAIRQHMREICPSDINNLLQIIHLSIKLERFTGDDLTEWGVIELLQAPTIGLDFQLLLQVLRDVLDAAPLHPTSLQLAEACLPYFPNPQACFNILLPASIKIGYMLKQYELAASLVELYFRLGAENIEALQQLTDFYQHATDYSKGIETAKLCYSRSQTLPDKIYGIHLVLRGLLSAGGYWEEVLAACQELESLMLSLIEAQPIPLPQALNLRLLAPFFSPPHVKDEPTRIRPILNQVAQLFQTNIQFHAQEQTQRFYQRRLNVKGLVTARPLKIGYLSNCLRTHSVGWLARGVFEHHNRDHFQVHAYFANSKHVEDNLQQWYVERSCKAYKAEINALEIAEKIYQDEIDILIDLDSISVNIICKVMALKPAPVQVTWLGGDASGLPAIDYFIADPYVLLESAQDYYKEKIWRLPHTYIAVDGFEVGVPTLRRDHLNIPSGAVVYFSTQRGYKRHPDTVRLQMKIIKEVPNSYFLIKGLADEESIKSFFTQIGEAEGVDCDRLRFLPMDSSEAVHRANLGIADVVLDTYPYNGATTTLETLWMNIPLVTRVGQQFAARNSYTMLMNVGVIEGIAWTDEEYVEWGVRLGKDPALRQQIAWKLRQSRQTAPLWNAEQFTREMEKAYEQMWQRYAAS